MRPAAFDFVVRAGCELSAVQTAPDERIERMALLQEVLAQIEILRRVLKNGLSPPLTKVVLQLHPDCDRAHDPGQGAKIPLCAERLKLALNFQRLQLQ